jgi:protein ImuB
VDGPDPGPPRPLLLLPRPEPVEAVAEIPDGAPARFTWRGVARRVVRASGPERIAPEWWRALGRPRPPRTRDYYRVEDETGARWWLFRAGLWGRGEAEAPRWWLHGLFA